MPATPWGWLIEPDELRQWILQDGPELLVVNKPPHVVCHPSKHGPWSSLIGACREWTGLSRLYMPSRLDRETSGVMVFGKTPEAGQRLQHAMQAGRVAKSYLAIVEGRLDSELTMDAPIGPDRRSEFVARRWIAEDGQSASTRFRPLSPGQGCTLVEAIPATGRRHQIRVHAAAAGFPLVGDKLYGPDQALMLEFISRGWTPRLAAILPLGRHALHAAEIRFQTACGEEVFRAPFSEDLRRFCHSRGITVPLTA
jgi:23S rRNA pseudouridine1911/1915/1917 synthase